MRGPARNLMHWVAVAVLLSLLAPFAGTQPTTLAAQTGDYSLDAAPIATAGDIPVPTVFDAAGGVSVDPRKRADVVAFYSSQYLVSMTAPSPIGSVSGCAPGSTTSEFKAAMLQRINYFRAMAGVPLLTGFDAAASSANQQAALMMSANRSLSHDPPGTWACYTSTGDESAGRSNLALGTNGWDAINAYMLDSGGSNTAVGHRRWILYPPSRTFGTGDVAPSGYSRANALQVFGLPTGPGTTRDGFVAWPAPGYVPYQTVYPRWSFSLDGANFANATVTVSQGGRSVPVTVVSRTANGYGLNTLVWTMDGIGDGQGWPNPGEDKRYDITISNVAGGPYTYSVTVIDPANPGPTTMTFDKTKSKYNGWVTAALDGFAPGYTITLRWPGGTVLTQVKANSEGSATAMFRTPLVPYGTYSVRASDSAGNLALANLSVIPRILLNEYQGPPGTEIRVYFYGFSPGERVEVQWYTNATAYTVLTTITIADNGRGSKLVDVPANATTGDHTIRGKVIGVSRSATDTFEVTKLGNAEDPTATPSPSPTPTETETATPEPTSTPTETAPVEPTATEPIATEPAEPTVSPTEEPVVTETATAEPTVELPATETPVIDLTATDPAPLEPSATPTEPPVLEPTSTPASSESS